MKTLLLICSTFISLNSVAQEFSFPMYFEDALGNKDTIVLGYDPTATNGIDPQFGEIDILNQPWQGPLDVRIGTIFYYAEDEGIPFPMSEYLTKKAIQNYDCSVINNPLDHISIEFYAENLPVKIKWNNATFINDTCVYNTVLNGNATGHNYLPLYISPDSVQIKYIETQDFFFQSDTFKISSYTNYNYFSFKSYQNNGKEIGVLQFELKPKNTLSKNELTNEKINIYPNPTNGTINIETEAEITNIAIYDALGKSVFTQQTNLTSIDVSSLDAGIYMLKTNTTQGEVFTKIHKL